MGVRGEEERGGGKGLQTDMKHLNKQMNEDWGVCILSDHVFLQIYAQICPVLHSGYQFTFPPTV